jgi:hypothetical protein
VYRDGEKLNSALVTNTTYTDVNLLVGTYNYQVTALSDLCGETDKTEEVSVTILPELCEPPVNVTLINDETAILITWDDPEPEEIDGVLLGYNVYLNEIQVNEEIIEEKEYRAELTETGSYQVSIVYEHCESELSKPVGIKEHWAASYTIFPNPTSGNVTIEGEGLNRIEIYDVQGRKLVEYNNINDNLQINVNKYENGIYFVKMYSDNNIIVTKQLVIIK